MTVSTQQNLTVFSGDGATTTFNFAFNNGVPAGQTATLATYTVTYTDASGNSNILDSASYTLSFTAAATGQVWGIGGTLTYPLSGSAIASGTTLTIKRTFPYQQLSTISNQGAFAPTVIESAIDNVEMQLQQVSDTASLAIQIPSTDSGINTILPAAAARANKYAAFDSGGNVIATATALSTSPTNPFYAGGTTGGTTSALTLSTNPANFSLVDGCMVTFRAGASALAGATLNVATTGAVALKTATSSGLTAITLGQIISGGEYTAIYSTTAWVVVNPSVSNSGGLLNVQIFTATGAGTYTPTAGMRKCIIKAQGAGGGSGGSTGTGSQSASSGAGGGGDYIELLATATQIGASAPLVVGIAGTAGASGNNAGGDGADTTITIGGGTSWKAGGGKAGAGQTSSGSAQVGAAPGAGGTKTTGTNATLIVDIPGQTGNYGQANGAVGGSVSSWNGKGGDSFLGKGGPQGIGASATGGLYGAGASGYYNASGSNQVGSAGAQGIIIIEEY